MLFYSKIAAGSAILIAVSMDPYADQQAILEVPLPLLGLPPGETYQVHELISDERSLWQGPTAQVKLTLAKPAAIFAVLRFKKTEQGFDYFF